MISKNDLRSAIIKKEAEIRNLEKAIEDIKRNERREKLKQILPYKDALLQLMTHSCQSCKTSRNNYYNPNHGFADCNKCCLEDLSECDDDVEVLIDIRLTKKVKPGNKNRV